METFEEWKARIAKLNPNLVNIKDNEYDLEGAYKAGLDAVLDEETGEYHLPSRDPETGLLLKMPNHPTYQQMLDEEKALGYKTYEKDGRMYSEQDEELQKQLDAKYNDPAFQEAIDRSLGRNTNSPGVERIPINRNVYEQATSKRMYKPHVNSMIKGPLKLTDKEIRQLNESSEGYSKEVTPVVYWDIEGRKIDRHGNLIVTPPTETENIVSSTARPVTGIRSIPNYITVNPLEAGVLSSTAKQNIAVAKSNTDNLRDEMLNSKEQPFNNAGYKDRQGFVKGQPTIDKSWINRYAVDPKTLEELNKAQGSEINESPGIASNLNIKPNVVAYNEVFTRPTSIPKTEYIPDEQPILTEVLDDDIINTVKVKDTKPIGNRDPLPLTTAASIISGVGALGSAAANIYGAIQANKSRPVLAGYRAPIEPELVQDRSQQIKAGSTEQIDKAFGGIYDANRRYGRPISGDLISKELSSINELSSKLAEYRTSVDTANVNTVNTFKQYNDQAERQRDQFNVQTQNQHEQQKAGIISAALSGVSQSINAGAQSIIDNMTIGKGMQYAGIKNEMKTYQDKINEIESVFGPEAYSRSDYNEAKKNLDALREKEKNYLTRTYGKY